MFRAGDIDLILNSCSTVKVYNSWNHPIIYTSVEDDGDPDARIVIMKGWKEPAFRSEDNCPNVRDYLLTLNPKDEIREEYERFELPERCVGVHLRRLDKHLGFSVSSDEHFEKIMDEMIVAEPSIRFFISTDDAITEKKFMRRYLDRALIFEKACRNRRFHRGMEEAVIDLFLLGRTNAIIGNHYSSFSRIAGLWAGKPVLYATQYSAEVRLEETIQQLLSAVGLVDKPVSHAIRQSS